MMRRLHCFFVKRASPGSYIKFGLQFCCQTCPVRCFSFTGGKVVEIILFCNNLLLVFFLFCYAKQFFRYWANFYSPNILFCYSFSWGSWSSMQFFVVVKFAFFGVNSKLPFHTNKTIASSVSLVKLELSKICVLQTFFSFKLSQFTSTNVKYYRKITEL